MSGRILVTDPAGALSEGGDRVPVSPSPPRPTAVRMDPVLDHVRRRRQLRLFDKRRLGRVRLDPDRTASARTPSGSASPRSGTGSDAAPAPVKARLLDQSVLAGVGNLLADETLWQARLDPRRRVDTLAVTSSRRAQGPADGDPRAVDGGVHTGVVMGTASGRHCPRCGAVMVRATVGGRTTWVCPREQT